MIEFSQKTMTEHEPVVILRTYFDSETSGIRKDHKSGRTFIVIKI